MKRSKNLSAIAFFYFLTVTLASGPNVKFDYDHSANFSKYKTFSWIKEPVTMKDPLMQQRIVNAVNAQLKARGLQPVDNNGDLGVAVNVATLEKQTLNTFYDGFGPWYWGLGSATTMVETFTEGTIVADLFDTKTKRVVWRGVGSKEISNKPGKATEQVEKTIEKMFKQYPPKAL
jgi:hypothetical protein